MSVPASDPPVKLPGFVDATKLFFNACDNLSLGQLVHPPGFTMMDTMGAVEAMEPRTDIGMESHGDDLPAEDQRPDAESVSHDWARDVRQYTVADVCFIMDRVLACDVAFQSAQPLVRTLYTCRRLHEEGDPQGLEARALLLGQALNAYLSAVCRCTALLWRELVRGNVYDGEDFQGDKSGLTILDTYCESTQDAVAQLDAVLVFLDQTTELNANERDALKLRLQFRKYILLCIDLLEEIPRSFANGGISAFASHIAEAEAALERLSVAPQGSSTGSTLLEPHLSSAPSGIAAAMFDTGIHRRLASYMPSQARSLPSASDTLAFYRGWLRDALLVNQMLQEPGWAAWHDLLVYGGRAAPVLDADQSGASSAPPRPREKSAYMRSVMQSAICTNPSSVIAGCRTLDWLRDSFLRDSAGLDGLKLLDRVHWLQTLQPGGAEGYGALGSAAHVGAQLNWCLPQLTGYLVDFLCTLCQNHPRQHRNFAKRYRQWVTLADSIQQLSEEAGVLDGVCGQWLELLHGAVQSVILGIMLQIVLLGLQLDLYAPTELLPAWYVTAVLAHSRSVLLDQMLAALEPDEATAKAFITTEREIMLTISQLAEALEQICATQRVRINGRVTDCSFGSVSEAAFKRRFKWLGGSVPAGVPTQLESIWARFEAAHGAAAQDRSAAITADRAQQRYKAVRDMLSLVDSSATSVRARDTSSAGPAQTYLAGLHEQARKYHRALSGACDEPSATSAAGTVVALDWRPHVIFPSVSVLSAQSS